MTVKPSPFAALAAAAGLAVLVLADSARAESFRFDFHNLVTQKHERIKVNVRLPREPAPARPGLIYLTGCDGGIQDSTRPIFDALLKQGFVIAHIESLGYWTRRPNACTSEPGMLTGAQRAEEAYRARDVMVERGWVAADNVALLGYSHGGWTISHAMFLDPTPNYDTARTVPFAAAVAFYPWCQTNESPTFRNRTPTLMLGGDRDEWTPFARCRQLERAARRLGGDDQAPLELHLYENATHSWDRDAPRREFWAGPRAGMQTMEFNPQVTEDSVKRTTEWIVRHTRR